MAAMPSVSSTSNACRKRSAFRRVSVTKLSRIDFAASGSSREKAVRAEKFNAEAGTASVAILSVCTAFVPI